MCVRLGDWLCSFVHISFGGDIFKVYAMFSPFLLDDKYLKRNLGLGRPDSRSDR